MEIQGSARRRFTAVAAALTIMLAACGSDAVDIDDAIVGAEVVPTVDGPVANEDDASEADEDETPVATPTASAVEQDTDDSAEIVEPERLELASADWDGLTEWNLPVMGGLTFGVPDGLVVIQDGDMVAIRTASDLDRGKSDPTMIIARVYQIASGTPVSIADMTSSAIADFGSAEPTGTTISLLGEELDGWRFTLNDEDDDGPFIVFSAYPAGTVGPTNWHPFPHAEVYLAEVAGGVLAVGWTGEDGDAIAQARAIFDRVAPTLELTRPFEETADPVTPPDLAGAEPPLAPVPLPEGWPAELTSLSAPVEPGDYSHLGFGTAFSFAVTEGWSVEPNFPGWLVLSGGDSSGPGDRGLVFRAGATGLVPVLRTGAAGEERPLDLVDIVDNPPEGLEILDSGDVVVGGVDGYRVRFAFDESADCAAMAICEYWLMTKYPFPPASIRTGYQYELFHLENDLPEPISILIETYDDRWFDRAQEVIDSIKFDTPG